MMKEIGQLMERLEERLIAQKMTIGTVESLTAGLFASSLASVPGVSKTFRGSLLTYDPALKTSLAGVDPLLIEKFGVVSEEVAIAMAKGGQKALGVDVCLSCTGNAGPTAQEGEAPVGSVYMAIALPHKTICLHKIFASMSRNEVREATVLLMALTALKNI